MNNILQAIQDMREQFGWDQTDTIEFMTQCVLEEAKELNASLEDEENFKGELAYVLMYLLSICMDRNYDVEEIILNKISEVRQREY